jgi:Holliday junction DNA helicase RuvA
MIARISGRLQELLASSALVDTGAGLWYEVLLSAADIERLASRTGQDISLHTIHYFEGDPSHGQVTPRLVGFLAEEDREFFTLFTSVKGIGIRKALRSLVRPVADVAAAICDKDVKYLKALPEIGARTAERLVTELRDKVEAYRGQKSTGQAPDRRDEDAGELTEAGKEAVVVLVQLGEKRPDAVAMVERVQAVAPELESAEQIIPQVYRIKAGGG